MTFAELEIEPTVPRNQMGRGTDQIQFGHQSLKDSFFLEDITMGQVIWLNQKKLN